MDQNPIRTRSELERRFNTGLNGEPLIQPNAHPELAGPSHVPLVRGNQRKPEDHPQDIESKIRERLVRGNQPKPEDHPQDIESKIRERHDQAMGARIMAKWFGPSKK